MTNGNCWWRPSQTRESRATFGARLKALNVWVSILGMRNHIELLQKISPRQRQGHPPNQMERHRLPIKTPLFSQLGKTWYREGLEESCCEICKVGHDEGYGYKEVPNRMTGYIFVSMEIMQGWKVMCLSKLRLGSWQNRCKSTQGGVACLGLTNRLHWFKLHLKWEW